MAIILFVACSLVAFQVNLELGSLVAGVLCLAMIRTFRTIDRFQVHDMPLLPRAAIRLFWASAAIATIIIGISSLVALFVYGLAYTLANPSALRRGLPFMEIDPLSIIFGLWAAAPTAKWLRKKLW